MDREKALMQLKDLLYNFENFEEVEITEEDVQALKYVIRELERTAPEVPVQEQSNDSVTTQIGCTKVNVNKKGITFKV